MYEEEELTANFLTKKTPQQFSVLAKTIFRKRNVLPPIFARKEQNMKSTEDSERDVLSQG